MVYKKISFCVSCKGRLHHLQQTLLPNIIHNSSYPNLEIVLLDYNSHDGLSEWAKVHLLEYIRQGIVVYYRYPDGAKFHMAHAKNMSHRLATGEILCNLDADNFTSADFAFYINDKLTDQTSYLRAFPERQEHKGGCGGRIAIHRHQFFLVGGYAEQMSSWSPDDKDLCQRLDNCGQQSIPIDEKYLARIAHDDNERVKHYTNKIINRRANISWLRRRRHLTIDNQGRFGCGHVYRNFEGNPIELSPLPTRVFGIGWHKTGTTSLQAALDVLGMKGRHFPYEMYTDMTSDVTRIRAAETNYSLTDFPVPLAYEVLDKLYPFSKFILTIRDTQSWLNSVRTHFTIGLMSRESLGGKSIWDKKNPKKHSHDIHELAYGTREFNEVVFRERYERHNKEVGQYFANRSEDFLVMDMSTGAGWRELCGFLKQPVPSSSYPRQFVTRERIDFGTAYIDVE